MLTKFSLLFPKRAAFNKRIAFSILWAFIIFTAGYLTFYGKQAADSGSWRYIINHNDEFSYWAYAKGASLTPQSDGNPFYYEDRGTTHSIPYTTTVLIGKIARLTHLPILFFFPIWHIGMPFLLWLALFFSLWKFWRYSPSTSAAMAMAVLLSTLVMRGQGQVLLSRFSRPGEALWLLVLWVSLVMNPPNSPKKYIVSVALLGLIAFWLHPLYAIFGIFITSLEALWQIIREKKWKHIPVILSIWCAWIFTALSYYLYTRMLSSQNQKLAEIISESAPRGVNLVALILYIVIVIIVLIPRIISRESLTKIDRLCLFVFIMEPLCANVQVFLSSDYQMGAHRYYFLIIEICCLIGLWAERIPRWCLSPIFRKFEFIFVMASGALIFWMIKTPQTNFFRHGPITELTFNEMDNSLLLLTLLPMVAIFTWALFRFKKISAFILRTPFVAGVMLLAAIAAYANLPCQMETDNRHFPFDGAYRWFNLNAQDNDVVLTLSPGRRWMQDYLVLYTNQKAYLNNAYGQKLTVDPEAKVYRRIFHAALLLNRLADSPIGNYKTLEEKINHLRLDYLLINIPSPFVERIERQLQGYLEEVYRDNHCQVWRVLKKKKAEQTFPQ